MKRMRFARAGAALTLVAMGAGCNLLLDLDGYRNALPQDAGSQPPFDAGPEVTPPPPPPPDATPDVFDPIPESVLAARWARFPMVDKPDGSTSTTDAGAFWVDSNTGLSWRDLQGTQDNAEGARSQCATNKMRLPTRIELVTLLDLSASKKFTPFVGMDGIYWTSSPVFPRTKPEKYWTVTNDGTVKPSETGHRVICVLGKEK
jgi:hypothetical protein